MVSGLKSKTYHEPLKEVGLTTLEDRRKRGDMIEVWKVVHNKEDVETSTWLTMTGDRGVQRTRQTNDQFHIQLPQFKSDLRKNFWSIRVVENWNALPAELRAAESINSFKNQYDEHYKNSLSRN